MWDQGRCVFYWVFSEVVSSAAGEQCGRRRASRTDRDGQKEETLSNICQKIIHFDVIQYNEAFKYGCNVCVCLIFVYKDI